MSTPDRYTCEDAFRRLDDYLDGELAAADAQRVRDHLDVCASCAREYAVEEALLAAVRAKLRRVDPPAELREAIARLLAAEGGRGDEE